MIQEARPWEYLKEQIEQGDEGEIKRYLDTLQSEEVVGSVSHLNENERVALLSLLTPKDAADLVDDLPWAQAVDIINELDSKDAAAIISDSRATIRPTFSTRCLRRKSRRLWWRCPAKRPAISSSSSSTMPIRRRTDYYRVSGF